MPRIFDNIEHKLVDALRSTLKISERADFCVGYFNLRGWRHIETLMERWQGGADGRCRLMIGMQDKPEDELRKVFSLRGEPRIDQGTVARLKTRMAQEFREQLLLGAPTNEDQEEQLQDDEPARNTSQARQIPITWQDLKTNPGAVGLESVLHEIDKIRMLTQRALPADLFEQVSPKVVTLYRQRATTDTLYELRRHPDATRYTLLAAFCQQRTGEVTDSLVDLLLLVIRRIGAKAEKHVKKQYLDEIQTVEGKQRLLRRVAEASLAGPEKTIRAGIFPVMSEEKCKAILKEYQAKGEYQEQVYQRMRASYRSHYRRMVPLLVNMLDIRSNNTAHQPVADALTLVKRYVSAANIYYPTNETIPLAGVVRPMWRDLVVEKDKEGETRINRVNYELCVLDALQEKLRCRELWVVGANKYRNPGDDLSKDFEEKRTEYYEALGHPEKAMEHFGSISPSDSLLKIYRYLLDSKKDDYGKK
jgi:hypothetical protein